MDQMSDQEKDIEQVGDEEEDEEAERYVDYDSEENEVEVTLTKKDKKRIVANFVENEAELSESEWGSADEDEKDLDRYDMELADEEQFDQKQLQQELEKIHNRQMLDQDNREVEQLKEFFLEDEENDGVGRVRQFRWKNVEKTFTLDYDKQKEGDHENEEGADGNASDEETELAWRKMRHERNMLLKEQNINLTETELSTTATLLNPDDTIGPTDGQENNQSVGHIGGMAKKKITIVKRTTTASTGKEDSPFLISKCSVVQGHKASFLSRDPETLNKLANLVKSNPETEGSSTVVASKGRNFVFTALSPAIEKVGSKRSLDSEDAEERTDVKKPKTATVNSVTLLGRVGADPQRRGNDDHPVVMFSLATHSNYKYDSGDWMQKTDWHRVVVFKPGLRDSVMSYLKKGQRTMVTGKITYGEITDQEGKQRGTTSIIADDKIVRVRSCSCESVLLYPTEKMAAVALSEVQSAKSIICDIEGTTTSISFVKDTLFPYALKNVEEFLKNNWNEDATKTVIAALREQADEDKKSEVAGVVPIPAGDSEDIIPDIVKNVEWQMSQDRKTGSLKTLQGMVWAKGYKDGTIKGHVYDDVQKSFEKWTESGRKIYIYSSGSVDAQKLLFENSEQGNLLKYLAGHYDTKIGAKREKESYQSILKNIEASAEEALFLTDVFAEAKAAKEAGLHVVLLERPGNSELSEEERKEFPVISTFSDLTFAEAKEENGSAQNGKRKIEETTETTEEDQTQEPPSKVVKVEEGKKEDTTANGSGEGDKEMAEVASADDAIVSKKDDEVPEKKIDDMEVDDEKKPTNGEENVKKTEEKSEPHIEETKSDSKDNKEPIDSKSSNDEVESKQESIAAMDVDEQDNGEVKKEAEKKGSVEVNETVITEETKVAKDGEKKEENKGNDKVEKVVQDVKESKADETTKVDTVEDDKDSVEKTKEVETDKDNTVEQKETVVTTVTEQDAKKEEEAKTAVKEDEKQAEKTSEKEENKPANVDLTPTEQPTSEKKTAPTETTDADDADAKVAATNGEKTEDKPTTNSNGNGNAGDEEKNGDSDKENDTSSTNCEVDEASAAAESKTNGSNTSVDTSSSVQEVAATAESKTKKVVDVVAPPAVTPTPPIEAES
ncbi:enolase-phosphatase E1-like [Anopheles ziemanni]|uniref:enolase-phosphatase E1-like n=1 Tax=Anopheles ziemanni TaxID=345580 RepID=UPI00265FA43A|nr:enolase-phosphatase E1-like [Anopheles ziemanni]